MTNPTAKKRVVVIGGGTGTSTVVSGLKSQPLHLTALVSVADSGGSTGRLRDEFGFQPVGDLRQSLAALAEEDSQEWIRKLLLYRFEKGEGLKGHNLGNLILTALQDMAGSTMSALEIAEQVFQLRGEILPVTAENVQLVVEYADGHTIVGEDNLNTHGKTPEKIKRIRLSPEAELYEKSAEAIKQADLIVIGPGDYYASVMAALAVENMKSAMKQAKGKIVYIVNLMTRFNQTHDMTAKDHLLGIEEAIGRPCDYVIVNSGEIPQKIVKHYEYEQEYPVVNDLKGDARCIARDIVSHTTTKMSKGDTLERSLLRHDPGKLSKILMELL